jgi:hypothetical protein
MKLDTRFNWEKLARHLPATTCGLIVGGWMLFVLTIHSKLILAVLFAAIAFLFCDALFLDSEEFYISRFSKGISHLKWSLPILLFILFLIVVLVPVHAPIVYQPWQEIASVNWLRFFITIPLTFFFPGYLVLKLLDKRNELSKIESFTLSLILSFFFVSLVGFILQVLNMSILVAGFNAFIIFYVIIVVSYIILQLKTNLRQDIQDVPKRIGLNKLSILLLLVIISVLALVYSIPYEYGLSSGDALQQLGESLIFEKDFPVNNGKYGPYPYWISIFCALFFLLSSFPAVNAYIILHFITVIPILSFYLFASTFFERDKRIAVVGAILFPLFAGIGWIYTLFLQNSSSLNLAQLISLTGNKTYDLTNIVSQFAYTLDSAQIVGVTCFLIAIYIARRQWKVRYVQYILLSITIALSYLAHNIVDVIMFVVLFSLYQLFSTRKSVIEYRKIGVSIIIGLLSVGLIDFVAPGTTYTNDRFGVVMANVTFIISCSMLVISIFLSYLKEKISIVFSIFSKHKLPTETLSTLLAAIIIFIYGLCFVLYFTVFQDLVPLGSVVYTAYSWPWFIYPLRFGFVGLLATGVVVYYMLSKQKVNQGSIVILSVWAFIILASCWLDKSIWFLPSSIKSMLLENKLQGYLWIPLCLLASYGLVTLISKFRQSSQNQWYAHKLDSNRLIGALLLSLLLVGGTTSTLLYVENETISHTSISTEEFEALNYLNSVCTSNVSVATVVSSSVLNDYAGIPKERIFDRSWEPLLYSTSSLESVIKLLFNYNIRYLYIAFRDAQYINRYSNSYLFNHLIRNLPLVFNNTEVQIYEIPSFSPPNDISSLAVVIPQLVNIEQPNEPDENTVALYHFDEGSGAQIGDSGINHNNGVMYNGTWVLGKFGNGILCNGVNTYVNCGNDKTLDITSEIRIEAWVKLNFNWNSTGIICIKADGTDWNKNNYYLRVDAGRTVSFIWGNGTAYMKYTSLPKLDVNTWYLIAIEWNKIFINGEEVETRTYGTATSHITTTHNLYIGASGDYKNPVGDFNGIIDDLCILNSSVEEKSYASKIFDYYYQIETVALSNLNYAIISSKDGFSTYSNVMITDNDIVNASSFLNWVENGYTLLLLNTYDFGPFAKILIKNLENNTFTFDRISGQQFSYNIPDITSFKIKPAENVQIIANYTNKDGQTSPFALLKPVGAGRIIYVYLAPYLKTLEESPSHKIRQLLFSKLKYVLTTVDPNLTAYHDTLNRAIYPPPDTHAAIAEDINFTGDISFEFDAFAVSQTGNLYARMIKSGQISQSNVYIQSIESLGSSFSTINGKAGAIIDGSWNYALVRLDDDFNWTIRSPIGSIIEMSVLTEKGFSDIVVQNDTLQIIGIRSQPNRNSTEILMKNLDITMDGQLNFGEFYHVFPFWINQTGVRIIPYSDGAPISFEGDIGFPVYIVKPKTLYLSSFIIHGNWTTPAVSQPQQFVPWGSIIISPIWVIMVVADVAVVLNLKRYMTGKEATPHE